MGDVFTRLRQWWATAEKTQRLTLIVGVSIFVFLGGFVFFLASRPKYAILFSGISDTDKGAVAAELESMGMVPHYETTGVVEVPAERVAEARMKLAQKGKLPKAQGGWGNADLSKIPMGATPSVEAANLKMIVEGEIAQSIASLEGVESARVQITLPTRALFQVDEKPPTASVTIIESASSNITQDQARAIAVLVSNAVPKMTPRDVAVVNQRLRMVWNGQDQESEITGSQRKNQMEDEVARKRQSKLQAILDQAYGAGSTLVSVNLEMDMSPEKSSSIVNTPSEKPSKQETVAETMSGGARGPTGTAGVGSNAPSAPATGTSTTDKGQYQATKKGADYLVNSATKEVVKALGGIQSMAYNVVADTSRISDLKGVEDIVRAEIGNKIQLDPQGVPVPNQPFSVKVTGVEFDKTAAKQATEATSSAAASARMQQIISLVPIGALMFIAMILIRQFMKIAKSYLPNQTQAITAEGMGFPVLSTGGGGGGGGSMSMGGGGEANADRLLAQLGTGDEGFEIIDEDDGPLHVRGIKDKVNMPLEQIKKMGAEKPQVVAMLVKSMLLEEKR